MSEQIKALDDRSRARDKISVWLGSNTHQAVMHTTIEATTNSCDLIADKKGDAIIWTLFNEKEIQVEDNCTGLPVEGTTLIKSTDISGKEIETEKPNHILLLATMFAGTKYDSLETGKSTTGTNGLFLSILSLCSEYVEYTVGRPNGNIYYCSFENGYLKNDLKIIGNTDKTFTKIKYKLSDEVFTGNYFTFDEICEMAQKQSSLIKGSIKVIDIKNNQEKIFTYENGIIDLLNELSNPENKITDDIIINNKEEQKIEIKGKKATDKITINLVMNYSKDEENTINMEFLNRSHLIHHGTIYDGFIEGLRRAFNQYLKQEGKYNKNEKAVTKDDVLCGLNYIINFTSLHPTMFQNQTKFSTDIQYFKDIMIKTIANYFEVFSIEQKQIMEQLCTKILINKRSREKAENSRKEAKKVLEETISNASNRPPKFVPCRSKKPEEIDFIVIEGDSSLNSIKLARDSRYTCIMPLKGKPINPFKCKIDELLNNDEVLAIYKIMGCGITYKGKPVKGMPIYNKNKMQVNNLLIATDFDFDGFHIQALLIGIIYVLSPDLLEQGKVFILYTPLYVIRTKVKVEYKGEKTNELLAYSEEERNTIVRMLKDKNISFKETRFKGLGGLPVPIMSKALNKDTRILKQITMEDVEESKKWLELFLSDEQAKVRKEFIETYGKEYFDYSLFE